MNRIFEKTLKQTITAVEVGMHKGISSSYGGSFRDWMNEYDENYEVEENKI